MSKCELKREEKIMSEKVEKETEGDRSSQSMRRRERERDRVGRSMNERIRASKEPGDRADV